MAMASASTEFPFLQSPDHKVLGTEFCSGYSDDYGEWNTGFYCPQTEPSFQGALTPTPVSCCGTPTYKYCCTGTVNVNANVNANASTSHINNATSFSSSSSGFPSGGGLEENLVDIGPFLIETPLLLSGIVCGAVMTLLFITFGLCYYCSCCILHQKRIATTTSGTRTGTAAASATRATSRSNVGLPLGPLHRLGLGSPCASTISATATNMTTTSGTSSSGLGSSVTGQSQYQTPPHAPPQGILYSPPPLNTFVNLSNGRPSNSSGTPLPLLEMVGRDFVYSPNQWQAENVYNQCGSASVGSSSGVYSNPSSSPYSHAHAHTYAYPCPMPMPFPYPWVQGLPGVHDIHRNVLGSFLIPATGNVSPYAYPNTSMNNAVSVSNNSWCSNPYPYPGGQLGLGLGNHGANRNPTANEFSPPPPYSYSQQVHSRGNNPNSHAGAGPPSQYSGGSVSVSVSGRGGSGHQSNPSLSATNYGAASNSTGNRIKPTPAEILLYERILRALLKDRDVGNGNGRSAVNSNSNSGANANVNSRQPRSTAAACTLPKINANKTHLQQSASLRAKSVNTIIQQPGRESKSTTPARDHDHVPASRPS